MKILIRDHGLCLEAATFLARHGHDVYYNVLPVDKHSLHDEAQMGSGFEKEGVHKVEEFYEVLPKMDVICFFDTYSGDEVDFLRAKGYHVFGAGLAAEQLELDRAWAKREVLHELPSSTKDYIKGVSQLIEYLQTAPKCWVKCSGFREIETFCHESWNNTQEQYIAPLLVDYGADPNLEFIIEEDVEPAVEVGADCLVVHGEWPVMKGYGYESKDSAYVGRFNSGVLPTVLNLINVAVQPHLRAASTFFSSETRVTPNRVGYPLDLTLRAPHPPFAGMLEVMGDLDKLIIEAATLGRIKTEPFPRANYCAVLVGTSGWAEEHRCEITFPAKLRQWVKFQKAYKQGNSYYVLPSYSFAVLVVGIGNTPDAACKGCKLIADQVHGRELSFDFSALDKILDETIPTGKKSGIAF